MKYLPMALLFCATSALASITDYGADRTGVSDSTPAFNAAVSAVCASQTTRTLTIPVGRFVFRSQPAPIPCALNIRGEGPAVTHLIRGASMNEFIVWTGGQDSYGGGSIRDLSIDAGRFTGGIGLTIRALAENDPARVSRNPHGLIVENVFIVAAAEYPNQGHWNYGLYLDGSLNANPPAGVAPGIRLVRLSNINVSRFAILPYLFYHSKAARAVGLECWIPVGTGQAVIWRQDSEGTRSFNSGCRLGGPGE